MKIVLAVDGSTCSDRAVEEVARRPWPKGSQVKILSAFRLHLSPTAEPWFLPQNGDTVWGVDRARARETVDRAFARLQANKSSNLKVMTEVIEGSPKRVILDEAGRWGADLIVVGSHGREGLDRFLLGSVSQAVALHAKCSVEIVRCPDQKRERRD